MHADMHIKKISYNMRNLVEKLDTPVQANKWKKKGDKKKCNNW